MNDAELITAVRESFTDVRSTTPAAQIVKRGRAVRARRRVPGAAAVGAVAAAAVAVSVALAGSHPPAGHPASGPGVVRLAAWTVTRQAGGSIKVTFREAADAAGLQRTLRADGVPASVTFTGRQNPACRPSTFSGSPSTPAGQPFRGPVNGLIGGPGFSANPKGAYTTPYALVINPSKLPSSTGLQIWTSGAPGPAGNFQLQVGVVQASPQCTGS
jgi:hypothetical protein